MQLAFPRYNGFAQAQKNIRYRGPDGVNNGKENVNLSGVKQRIKNHTLLGVLFFISAITGFPL
jgi:hypothetical protein